MSVVPTIGMVFSLCMSLYISGVMLRQTWHRFRMRAVRLADTIMRRKLSTSYHIMIERIGADTESRPSGSVLTVNEAAFAGRLRVLLPVGCAGVYVPAAIVRGLGSGVAAREPPDNLGPALRRRRSPLR